MAQQIDIPNVGIIEFPDDMSDAQITSAIETDILQTRQPDSQLTRKTKAFGSGMLGSVSSMASGVDWFADKFTDSHFMDGLINTTRTAAKNLMPVDATLADQVAAGFGSAATFFVPGFGVMKGAGLLARVTPALAKWGAVGTSAAMEAMAEAGGVYDEQKAKGATPAEAHKAANKTFAANLALVSITNKLGIFSDAGKLLRKAGVSAVMEAGQEGLQGAIASLSQGENINWDEIKTGSIVGAITGGGMGAVSHTFLDSKVADLTKRIKDKVASGQPAAEELAALEQLFTPQPTAAPATPPAPVTGTTTGLGTASASELQAPGPAQASSVAQESIFPGQQVSAPTLGQAQPVTGAPTPAQVAGKRKQPKLTPTAEPVIEAIIPTTPAEQMLVSQPVTPAPVTNQEETVYHKSKEVFKEGIPPFDSFFGTADFYTPADFYGTNVYELKIPKGTPIIDLTDNSMQAKNFVKEVIADLQKVTPVDETELVNFDPSELDSTSYEFYNLWSDKEAILPTIKRLGLKGARLGHEFILTKELINELSGGNVSFVRGTTNAETPAPVTPAPVTPEASEGLAKPVEPVEALPAEVKGFGPGGRFKTTPLSTPVYHETGPEGFNSLLRDEVVNKSSYASTPLFVTDNIDLALGQGSNKGILVEFDGSLVSGRPHAKPGIIEGITQGKEFVVNALGNKAILKITIRPGIKISMPASLKRGFSQQFSGQKLADGSVVYTRKETSLKKGEQAPATPVATPVNKIVKVYTGADKPFTKFDVAKIGTRTDAGFAGRGAYTTTDPVKASRWGKHVMETEVDPTDFIAISNISELYSKYGLQQMTQAELELPQDKRRKVYDKIIQDFTLKMLKSGKKGVKWEMSSGDTQYVLFEPDKYNFTPAIKEIPDAKEVSPAIPSETKAGKQPKKVKLKRATNAETPASRVSAETATPEEKQPSDKAREGDVKVTAKTEKGLTKVINKLESDISAGKITEDTQAKLDAYKAKLAEVTSQQALIPEIVSQVSVLQGKIARAVSTRKHRLLALAQEGSSKSLADNLKLEISQLETMLDRLNLMASIENLRIPNVHDVRSQDIRMAEAERKQKVLEQDMLEEGYTQKSLFQQAEAIAEATAVMPKVQLAEVPAIASMPQPRQIETQLDQLAQEIEETQEELYTINDVTSEDYDLISAKLEALEIHEAELYAQLDSSEDQAIIHEVLSEEAEGIFSERYARGTVDSTVTPEAIQKEAIATDQIPFNADEVRKGQRAYRFANGDIITGASFADMSGEVISTLSQRGGTSEQGYIQPDGSFISEALLRKQAEPIGRKRTVKQILKSFSKLATDERGTIGYDINEKELTPAQLETVARLREQFKAMEAEAAHANLSPEEFMRKAGFAELAISGYTKIKAMPIQVGEVITKATRDQLEKLKELNPSEETKRGLGLAKPLKELNYQEAQKLLTALGPVDNYEALVNRMKFEPLPLIDRLPGVLKFKGLGKKVFKQAAPPSVVMSAEEGSKLIHRKVVLSNRNQHRDYATMLDPSGLNMQAILKLTPEGSKSAEKVSLALEGKLGEQALTANEKKALDGFRAAYKYALNRMIDANVATPEEAALVRELAQKVIFNEKEDTVAVLKTLKEFKKTYNLSDGAMKALDIARSEKQNYHPHIFDRTNLKQSAIDELARVKKLAAKDARHAPYVRTLENLISKLDGGDLVVYKQIPRQVIFNHLKKRYNAPGYKLDAHTAFNSYIRGWLKEIHDTPMLAEIQPLFKTLSPDMKRYTQAYMNDYLGITERSDIAAWIRQMEWMRTLGFFNVRSALTNAIGGSFNTIIEAGLTRHAIQGYQRALTREGRHEFILSGAPLDIPQVQIDTEERLDRSRADKVRHYVGYAFNKIEYGLRLHAYHTGLAAGKAKGLTSEEDLFHYAKDFVDKTQYLYGKVDMPMGMRGWGGVIFQYQSYPVKTLALLSQWVKHEGMSGKLKFAAYIALATGLEEVVRRKSPFDISSGLGLGVRIGDLIEFISSVTAGEWEEVAKTWKLMKTSGGLLPKEVIPMGPIKNLVTALQEEDINKILRELEPVQMLRVRDFVYGLKDSANGAYPVYKYDGLTNPVELKYTLNLRDSILRAFGPKPSAETELQRREAEVYLTDREVQDIKRKFTRAIIHGDSKEVSRLTNHYGAVIGMQKDIGGSVKRELLKMTLTAEQRRQMNFGTKDIQRETLGE